MSIEKRGGAQPRVPKFVRRMHFLHVASHIAHLGCVRLAMLQKIAVLAASKPELKVQVGGSSSACYSVHVRLVCVCQWMLMLAAYVFLLRVPSEALPATAHVDEESRWPVLRVRPDVVEIWLPRRKNRLTPSTIERSCWCHVCRLTCPVHVLGKWLGELQPGARPFAHISPHDARSGLRLFLAAVGVEDAHLYWSHDLRRGHADDLREAGADAAVICAAGDWKSGAYLHYQDLNRREAAAVRRAYVVASSDEDVAPSGASPLSNAVALSLHHVLSQVQAAWMLDSLAAPKCA